MPLARDTYEKYISEKLGRRTMEAIRQIHRCGSMETGMVHRQ